MSLSFFVGGWGGHYAYPNLLSLQGLIWLRSEKWKFRTHVNAQYLVDRRRLPTRLPLGILAASFGFYLVSNIGN